MLRAMPLLKLWIRRIRFSTEHTTEKMKVIRLKEQIKAQVGGRSISFEIPLT